MATFGSKPLEMSCLKADALTTYVGLVSSTEVDGGPCCTSSRKSNVALERAQERALGSSKRGPMMRWDCIEGSISEIRSLKNFSAIETRSVCHGLQRGTKIKTLETQKYTNTHISINRIVTYSMICIRPLAVWNVYCIMYCTCSSTEPHSLDQNPDVGLYRAVLEYHVKHGIAGKETQLGNPHLGTSSIEDESFLLSCLREKTNY